MKGTWDGFGGDLHIDHVQHVQISLISQHRWLGATMYCLNTREVRPQTTPLAREGKCGRYIIHTICSSARIP